MEGFRNDIVMQGGRIDYPTMAKHLGNELELTKLQHGINDSTMGIANGLFISRYSIKQEIESLNFSLRDSSTNIFKKLANKIKLGQCTKNLKGVESQIGRLPFDEKTFKLIKQGLKESDSILGIMQSIDLNTTKTDRNLNYNATIIKTINVINNLKK